MIRKSYAKINFAINIKDKYDNGYHELDMIMAKINLFDKLYFSLFDEDKIVLTCTNMFIPVDEKNLVYQVAQRIKEKFNIKKGIRIHIAKTIPMQAGLGGGSANAATTIDALNDLFSLNLSYEDKVSMFKDLGSDIPFFFNNNICRVQGVGDEITEITNKLSYFYVVLVKPQRGISTRLVYEKVDLTTCPHPDIDRLVEAIKQDDYHYLVNNIDNSLEDSAIELRPVIKEIKEELLSYGVDVALVCGSGSTIFALTKDEEVVSKVKESHFNKRNFVYITRLI
ncbi:4-(cytidine 5'-diphospho)-2-C-methyl-D-erythritol kinase [Erysipelotrichaceae bacterium OttesenSCG-928-M19]|nr:4-(cytidine 5'-diphospho)-2-C-methyl-D-erythritol kinase [Erysipelotrichaceae bacterium OttesenSCG-928-M19]